MVVPDSGFITFNGKNIVHDWLYRRYNRLYATDGSLLPDNMTIGQVFSMMKDIRGSGKDEGKDESLIKEFGLDKILNKRMRTLSGGTRQKVSASLAFLFDPAVLILDEPTAGLDPVASEILKEKIIHEKSKGKLVLITSHILSELDDLITHVTYMQEGNLLFHKKLGDLQKDTGEQNCPELSRRLCFKINHEKDHQICAGRYSPEQNCPGVYCFPVADFTECIQPGG